MKSVFYPGKKIMLLILCLWIADIALAQTTVTVGTGTSSSYLYGPYYRSSAGSSFDYSRYAYLYTAAELGIPAGAIILKVEWNKKSGTLSGNNVFNILMKNTSATSLTSGSTWNSLTSGATTVYASTTQSISTGWVPFTLMTPFEYSGGNLMVMTDHEMTGTASGANNFYYHNATGKGLGYASSAAPTGSTTLSTSSYGNKRPNIRITWMPACPTEITIHPKDASACSNGSAVFYVQSDSTQAYQWQLYNGSAWANLSDNSNYSGTGTDTLKVNNITLGMDNSSYRAIVINTIENCSEESDPAELNVVPSTQAFAVLRVTPDTNICQGDEVTFYVSYTNGGDKPRYQWLKNYKEIPGEESPTFSASDLQDFDVISLKFMSSALCVPTTYTEPMKFHVSPPITPEVNVSLHSIGDDKIFTALPKNGGANPKYYWHINNTGVAGQNGPVFTTSKLGKFDKVHVVMKSSLECADPTIATSRNVTTGIENISGANAPFTLSPNPNTGQFIIKATGGVHGDKITITVTNMMGKTAYTSTLAANNSNGEVAIALPSTLPDGVYQATISAGEEISNLRFVLTR